MAIGRITGPLLKANLLRDGVDLAFETDLLYLDVINGRVGVKTSTPSNELTINGTTRTTNLEVTTQADIAQISISSNTISSSNSVINLLPSGTNPVVYQGTIVVDQLQMNTNTIATTGTNTNLEITTTGTGQVNFNSNVTVYGDLHATGNITADGDITIGNSNTDNVVFAADINSNILPNLDITYNLGSLSKRWLNLYSNTVTAGTVNSTYLYTPDFQTSGLDISGNTISARVTNTDINFNTTGTGGVLLGNLKFLNNTVTNIVSGAITTFTETGTGYVKISGTNGIVIPSGNNTTDRPSAFEVGMIRFNTTDGLVEVFNGSTWSNLAGVNTGVTTTTAQEIGIAMVLTLG
ncbi:hypothetical protein UFOVP181_356 [uncultured Caudovirales phage]|uniref:Uncharacterized protein n=1 Tax=uncultured Caudovirales phage TaxID=2100421 RepID=A0A6J7WHD9_9CAUD|nr:hypothetical protein UFOVP57_283 [uncultured Caudovirales phage]CAB5209205.1 hypothetical protein UFOVP181_356 [uncultured Caudovirales phage]